MKRIWLLLTAVLLVTSATASPDPFLGRWTLNAQRSNYPPGSCPKRMTIEMEAAGRGIHYRSESVYPNGATTRAEYTAEYNGKPAIVMGTHGMLLPVSLKRIDSHTVLASYEESFQIVATSRRVVSADGRHMTITTNSRNRSGKAVTIVGVYEKVMGKGK
jgi:hypothetical protein